MDRWMDGSDISLTTLVTMPPYLHSTPLSPLLPTPGPCGYCHSDSPRRSPDHCSIRAPSGLSPRGCCGGNATWQLGEGALPKLGKL